MASNSNCHPVVETFASVDVFFFYFSARQIVTQTVEMYKCHNITADFHVKVRAPAWSAYWAAQAMGVPFVTTYHGADGLRPALCDADIVVLLLPDTSETENTLDAEAMSWLPRGAVVINPGRGPLIDDDALLAALDAGQIAHATLDVFRVEPLPTDHPYWTHPQVTVTPHIASTTRPASSARVVAENIRRGEAGEPLLYEVDRTRGY